MRELLPLFHTNANAISTQKSDIPSILHTTLIEFWLILHTEPLGFGEFCTRNPWVLANFARDTFRCYGNGMSKNWVRGICVDLAFLSDSRVQMYQRDLNFWKKLHVLACRASILTPTGAKRRDIPLT